MIQNNRKIRISTGGSRKAVSWPESVMLWSEFVDKLKTPIRSTETLDVYMGLPKARQDELKDVGGFVGGTFTSGRRKACYVEGRDLATLDLDHIPAGQAPDILRRVGGLGCAAAVYSTRKHTGAAPRLRVVIPFDRTATADEYEPAARRLAALLGIEFCDPTTFEASRLMYWPSCCADGQYVYEVYDGGFCCVDGLLGMYGDWRDITQWPQVPGAGAAWRRKAAKQEDPAGKRGVIGAFCRTYTVTQAMHKFIPGIYEETAVPGRYTYTCSSTVGGAVIYDGDTFLYSHHATDPCSGLLVNAFDLVRLHKFGDRDQEAKEGTPANKLPSFTAMSRLALEDGQVSARMARERFEQAREAFAGPGVQNPVDSVDPDWVAQLSTDANGRWQKTVNNIVLILQNDPAVKGKIAVDEFSGRGMLLGSVPWDASGLKRQWADADDAGLFWYLENQYHIAQQDRQDKALAIVGKDNQVNEVRSYLQGLSWDGVRRVDTLLADYLGAADNAYTRAVMRKSLCAAVARAVIGAVKYDCMPIFTGPQGIGKSTFLATLGKEWFSDSLTTFEGKEAAEVIQGTWINEVGELSAFTRQETQVIKQFLSKRDDIYRAAYGRRTERHPRRCVFFGTSNDSEFLKDSTGNRRFWPVDVGLYPAPKSIWADLPREVDQVWAEAYIYWQLGEPLDLSGEAEAQARHAQEEHREFNGKEGLIRDFLERPVPPGWEHMDIGKRKMFWGGTLQLGEGETLLPRDRVCAIEIWVECLGGEKRHMRRADSLEINGILDHVPGWERIKTPRAMGPYGNQKGFRRSNTT